MLHSLYHLFKDENTRNYQRERLLNDRTTCFLNEKKVDEIVQTCSKESSEDEKKNAFEIVKTVFESSSCLNGSFLDPYVFGHNFSHRRFHTENYLFYLLLTDRL